ncbi:MAG: hypothetical protein ABI882_09845 [Acidobacteriota bacterium]
MKAQANNLGITNVINSGMIHSLTAQSFVCVFSFDELGWQQLPVDPTRANKRTVTVGSGYRRRLPVVLDP